MMYNKLLEDCFFHPRHSGIIGELGNTAVCRKKLTGQGATFEIALCCEDCGVISEACFRAYGTPYLIAALEWVCRQLQGEPLKLHPRIDYQQLIGILEIPQAQYPLALAVEEAYKDLVFQMKKKLQED